MAFTTNQIGDKASYGYIWMNTGNWTGVSFAFTTAFQELTSLGTNFTLASPTVDFAMTTDGRLKYTGAKPALFNVDANLSLTSNQSYAMQLYKNGSPLTGATIYNAGSGRMFLPGFPVSLITNDYISLYAKRSVNTAATILAISISAVFAGGMQWLLQQTKWDACPHTVISG